MLFSTKAEYGVRLMVALGRQEGERPVALASLADSETLPLSYLEHLVAKLRDAGLVSSQRHGGNIVYSLQTSVLEDIATEVAEMARLGHPSTATRAAVRPRRSTKPQRT